MLRAHAGPRLLDGRLRVRAVYEHYSGGSPADERVGAFDALFGTSHAFLGYADLFTALPAHTSGRGVADIGFRVAYQPDPGAEFMLHGHAFRAAVSDGLSSARFGEELDARLRYRVRAPLWMIGGVSYVWQGPALAEIGRLDRNLTFAYLMLNATF
jgi:hypothetical protein